MEAVTIGSADCDIISSSLTDIECELGAHVVGLADAVVTVSDKGYSPAADFTYGFALNNITSPDSGSPVGK